MRAKLMLFILILLLVIPVSLALEHGKLTINNAVIPFEDMQKAAHVPGEEKEEKTPITYIYANNQRIAKIEDGEINFYINDHLGSPRVVIDKMGEVIERMDYLPFGKEMTESNEKIKYNSKELDYDTDLYYYGARYYDASIGRFITPDTVEKFPNPYSYVNNNPMKLIDSTGNQAEDFDQTEEQKSMLGRSFSFISKGIMKTGKTINLAVNYGFAYSKIGETTLHEASHAVAFKAFGVGIKEFVIKPNFKEGYAGYVIPEQSSFEKNIGSSKLKGAIVDITPYAVDIAQHWIYKSLYKHDQIKKGSMIDEYIKTTIYLDIMNPMLNTGSGGDIESFAKNIGVNKYVVATALTGLYAYSAHRVYKASGNFIMGISYKW